MTTSKLRVLVVDDDEELRARVARHLEEWGFEVLAVGDAEAALELAAVEKVDAVVLDNNLPGMMGITALPKLVKRAKAPVIMVTGHPTDEIRRDALLLGAKLLFVKPLNFSALTAALDRLIPA